MRFVILLAAALLAACAPVAPRSADDPRGRDTLAAGRFEAWMQPRLGAVQVMLDASQQGVEFVSLVLRARQPGAGVTPPALDPALAGVARATAQARREIAGLAPLPDGDAEQVALAADTQMQVSAMGAGLEAFAASLPRLVEVGRALGPLGPEDHRALGESIARLLDVQVRADMVFADLVVGLLTPESDALPERELQAARWRGNTILLRALQPPSAAAAGSLRTEIAAAVAERRRDLTLAARKVDALRAAAAGLPPDQTGPIARVIRSYEEGLDAEEDFLDAVESFAPAIGLHALDALDAGGGRAASFEGARRLMDRLVLRLRANIARLRVLTEIGAGRRA